MKIIKESLWNNEKESLVDFTAYLLDNSKEIEENRKRPMVIVCPGGGYLMTSEREAEPVAMSFLNNGYNAIVLRYTTKSIGNPIYPTSLIDLAKMMLTVRENSENWNVDFNKIAICGFSAGAHLCASLAVHWQNEFLSNKLGVASEMLRPNAVILGYPLLDYPYEMETLVNDENSYIKNEFFGGNNIEFMELVNETLMGNEWRNEEKQIEASPIYHITTNVPPTFIWHTRTDDLVYVGNSLRFGEKLLKFKIPFEMHIYEDGPHGLSLADWRTGNIPFLFNKSASEWNHLALKFLNRHFEIKNV